MKPDWRTIALMALAGFIWLADYAWLKHPPVHPPTDNERIGQLLDAYERDARLHAFRFSADEPDDVYGALFAACEKDPKCYRPKKGRKS